MQIDKPEIVAEVRAAFAACKPALMANDKATLDALSWDHPAVIRCGAGKVTEGKAISVFRRNRDIAVLARRLTEIVLTPYRDDFATEFFEDEPTGSKRRGKQSRTALRTPAGCPTCAAHVSVAPIGSAS